MPPAFDSVLRDDSPNYDTYAALYKHFHSNAELFYCEHKTAAKVVDVLKTISPDLHIQTGIGGTGLIAMLRNGPGKTIFLRTDMDALPVKEQTGLEYACAKEIEDDKGDVHPVMHACGHDMHVAALLAAADTLVSSRAQWSGTVVFLFQQAEEKMTGAKAMVSGGLFTEGACPLPDVLLGQHVIWNKAGTVFSKPGPVMTAADGMTIRVHGRGGHGSQPHRTVDPAVLASHIVLRLQTIVSREVLPGELTVVTVGSMRVGTASNIIADEAVLEVSTRSVSGKWRAHIHDAIRRIVRAECAASNRPRDPEFEFLFETETIDNDKAVTAALNESFRGNFGDKFSSEGGIVTASEDLSHLATSIDQPHCCWFFGGYDPDNWERLNRERRMSEIPTNYSRPHNTDSPVS